MATIEGDAIVENGTYGHRAAVSNSSIVCKPAIAPSWTKIRLGMRYSQIYLDGYAIYDGLLTFGMCSGAAHPFLEGGETTHFAGMGFNGASVWSENTDTYTYSALRALTRVSLTTSWHASNLGNRAVQMLGNGNDKRTAIFVDITKGSPDYTFQCYTASVGTGITDFDDTEWATVRSGSTFPVRSGYGVSTAVTHPVDEGTNGTLDHVNVFWKYDYAHLYIEDISVHVIS